MFGTKTTSGQKSFGKLGNRSAARLDITIAGGLTTTSQSQSCRVKDISCTGCRIELSDSAAAPSLRKGGQVLVKFERAEAFGHIAWADGARCGVTFDQRLGPQKLARLRWIVDHPEKHQQNVAASAAMSWR